MNGVRYPALDAHLPEILEFFRDIKEFDQDSFYDSLGNIFDDYVYKRDLVNGSGPEGTKYPAVTSTKAYLKTVRNQLAKQIAWIDNNHVYLTEVTFPERGTPFKGTMSITPPHLEKLREALIAAQAAANATEPSLTGRVEPGRNPDVIQEVIDRLQRLFEIHSGKRATASSVEPDDHRRPSEFQKFAKACLTAFGAEIPAWIAGKINRKLDRSKSIMGTI